MKLNVGTSGYFKVMKLDANGIKTFDSGWQRNLILDTGLAAMASAADGLRGLGSLLRVGTGNSAPDPTQTTLDNAIAINNVSAPDQGGTLNGFYRGGNFDYCRVIKRFTFGMGQVVGNVTELGLTNTFSGTAVRTRALIKDAQGNPTSITVTSEEQLIVDYETRLNFDCLTPLMSSVDFDGTPIGVSFAIGRVSTTANTLFSANSINVGEATGINPTTENLTSTNVTAILTGVTNARSVSITSNVSSTANKRTVAISVSPSNGNGDIDYVVLIPFGDSHYFVFYFDTTITKTDQDVLEIDVEFEFTRTP